MIFIKYKKGVSPQGERGFTLIELLVVVAIIGVLSSVVLTSLNSARAKARNARRVSDIKQIKLAIEFARDNNGGELLNTSGTVYCLGVGSCWAGAVNNSTLDSALSSFINPIPTDPESGRIYNAYVYSSPGRYWLPAPIGYVSGGLGSYSIAWKPDMPDSSNPTPAQCEAMGGIYAAWDLSPGATHCPSGGSCRQCGVIVQ